MHDFSVIRNFNNSLGSVGTVRHHGYLCGCLATYLWWVSTQDFLQSVGLSPRISSNYSACHFTMELPLTTPHISSCIIFSNIIRIKVGMSHPWLTCFNLQKMIRELIYSWDVLLFSKLRLNVFAWEIVFGK